MNKQKNKIQQVVAEREGRRQERLIGNRTLMREGSDFSSYQGNLGLDAVDTGFGTYCCSIKDT